LYEKSLQTQALAMAASLVESQSIPIDLTNLPQYKRELHQKQVCRC
jgi:hypothetical protein